MGIRNLTLVPDHFVRMVPEHMHRGSAEGADDTVLVCDNHGVRDGLENGSEVCFSRAQPPAGAQGILCELAFRDVLNGPDLADGPAVGASMTIVRPIAVTQRSSWVSA